MNHYTQETPQNKGVKFRKTGGIKIKLDPLTGFYGFGLGAILIVAAITKNSYVTVTFFVCLFLSIIGLWIRFCDSKYKIDNPKRKLNKEEINFMVEYFHNEEDAPDIDGYVGNYTLPEEVMKEYRRRFKEERGWDD